MSDRPSDHQRDVLEAMAHGEPLVFRVRHADNSRANCMLSLFEICVKAEPQPLKLKVSTFSVLRDSGWIEESQRVNGDVLYRLSERARLVLARLRAQGCSQDRSRDSAGDIATSR